MKLNKIKFLPLVVLLASCETTQVANSGFNASSGSSSSTRAQVSENIVVTSDQYALSTKEYNSSSLTSDISRLKKTIERNPKDSVALRDLAELYLLSRSDRLAIEYSKRAIKADYKNSTPARKILAQAYYRARDYDKALVLLNQMGGVGSRDSDVVNLLGLIELKKDKVEYAGELFTKSINANTNAIAPRMNLGLLRMRQGRFRDASTQFERVLRVDSLNRDARLQLGAAYASLGEYKSALPLLEKAYSHDKRNPYALYNLALVHGSLKNVDNANKYLNLYKNTDYARQAKDNKVSSIVKVIQKNTPKKPLKK